MTSNQIKAALQDMERDPALDHDGSRLAFTTTCGRTFRGEWWWIAYTDEAVVGIDCADGERHYVLVSDVVAIAPDYPR